MGRRGSRRKKTRQLVAQERLSLTLLDWRWKGTRRNVGNSLWKLEKARESILSLCVCVYVCSICVCVLSHVWLCNPMDCSLPGSSVNGISQARILQQVGISYSRGSSWPRDRTCVSHIGRRILYYWATWGAHSPLVPVQKNAAPPPSWF